MVATSDKINVFMEPIFDNSIIGFEEHTYKPYGSPLLKSSDEIHISVNSQDLILDIFESYIYIEGTFQPKDVTKKCYLTNNALAFLFDEIRYEMGGEEMVNVWKPGITIALKTIASVNFIQAKILVNSGWGLTEEKQALLDKTSHVFSGKIGILWGFAEDYNKGIFNVKQELTLIITRNFTSYVGEVEANIKIDKIEW